MCSLLLGAVSGPPRWTEQGNIGQYRSPCMSTDRQLFLYLSVYILKSTRVTLASPLQHSTAVLILASLGAQPRAPRMALSIIKIKKMKKKNFQPITDPRGDEQLAGASDPLSCCQPCPSLPLGDVMQNVTRHRTVLGHLFISL